MKALKLEKSWTFRTIEKTIHYPAGEHQVTDEVYKAAEADGVTPKAKAKDDGDSPDADSKAVEILALLKADAAPLRELIPDKADVYSQDMPELPAWPFVKLGSAAIPQRLRVPGCANGAIVTMSVHAFAEARNNGSGLAIETAEDHAGRIGGLIEETLADNRLALGDGSVLHVSLADMQLLPDAHPSAFHYFAQINARVIAA